MSTTLKAQSSTSGSKSTTQVDADRAKLQRMLQCYPPQRQVKYLHLQAEMDMLIQQLQALKQQKAK